MNLFNSFIGTFPPFRNVYDFPSASKDTVSSCPFCNVKVAYSVPFARLDRYGFPVETHLCTKCSGLFVSPRLSPSEYSLFYDSGAYRNLIKSFSGKTDYHVLPQDRVNEVVSLIRPYMPEKSISVLNIGGTRPDYDLLSKVLDISNYVCMNPGVQEAGDGYEVWPYTIEQMPRVKQSFDLICLLGTINHLTEPNLAFSNISKLMNDDSLFVFDFKDPIAKMSPMSQPIGALQFDHPTYPSLSTLGQLLHSNGLTLLTYQTLNDKLYTFIATRNSTSSTVPPIFNRNSLKHLNNFRTKTSRVPRKLLLKSFLTLIPTFK